MRPLHIDNRTIAPGEPTLVIAEIGVNHDGSLARALELVDIAHHCGADAVKLQIFSADQLMHGSSAFAGYQKDRVTDADPAAMLRRYELPPDAQEKVVAHIRHRRLLPLATPFSPADVPRVAALDLPAVKIASPDLVNLPLLRAVAGLRRPMLLSTGAATMAEVEQARDWLAALAVPFALLHCISSYPTEPDAAHLAWIRELARFDVPVGYSDHATETLAGAVAVAAGACIVEKHLTYDRAAPGPDHAASADPAGFADYVRSVRLAERLLGQAGKRVLPIEEDVRRVSRQSLVLARDLPRNTPITADHLTVQRPGTGIPAAAIDAILNRRPRHDFPAGTLLQWDMLEP